ncbi:IS4 family transposase, partial [Azotobacter vinelandii]
CPPPPVPPRLGEMVEWVAGLGGYLGRKHDGPPGPKAMWIGLQRLREFVIALEARDALAGTYV